MFAYVKYGVLTTRYCYDKLNRMVREDNKSIGTTTVLAYDTDGNILTKTVYAFTLGALHEKTPVKVIPYSYRATAWRDQLTSFGGEKCEYDAIGNPTKYRDRQTTFKYGGRMTAFDGNAYAYDASGERVSKTVNGTETKFMTASGKVIRSMTDGTVIDFFYDNYGLSSIRHNDTSYFVRKNILGDIRDGNPGRAHFYGQIAVYTREASFVVPQRVRRAPFRTSILAICLVKTLRAPAELFLGYIKANERSCSLCATTSEFNADRAKNSPLGCVQLRLPPRAHIYDTTGNLAAKYVYDAWGNHKVLKADGTEDTDSRSIGNINPIRYRGYFFDSETGLYYLKARYYDPETGRFISADDTQFLDPNTVNGLNLYAYCGNNPVMNVDPSGQFAWLFFAVGALIAVAACALAGAVYGGISAAIHGENVWTGIGNGAAIGAMFGTSVALIALGVGTPLAGRLLGSMAVGAGVGSLSALGLNLYSQNGSGGVGSLDLGQVASSWSLGLATGAAAGAAGHILGKAGSAFGQSFGFHLSGRTFLGLNIFNVFSSETLINVFTFAFSGVGGFIGGNLVNYGATNGGFQEKNIPLWLITLLKFFGVH